MEVVHHYTRWYGIHRGWFSASFRQPIYLLGHCIPDLLSLVQLHGCIDHAHRIYTKLTFALKAQSISAFHPNSVSCGGMKWCSQAGLPTWLLLSQICQFWLFYMLFGFGKIVWLFGLILAFFMSKKTIYILNFPISITWGNGFQEVGNLHPSTEIFFIATRHHFKSIVQSTFFVTIIFLKQYNGFVKLKIVLSILRYHSE